MTLTVSLSMLSCRDLPFVGRRSSSYTIYNMSRLVRCHLLFASLVPSISLPLRHSPSSNNIPPRKPPSTSWIRSKQGVPVPYICLLCAAAVAFRRSSTSFTRPLSYNSHVFHYTHFYIESFTSLSIPSMRPLLAVASTFFSSASSPKVALSLNFLQDSLTR